MNSLNELWQSWRQDKLIHNVVRNSGYLFSSNTVSMGLSMVQSILVARMLGVANFGVLGTVTVFASTINRLFSFRMGELVVKYAGSALAEKRDQRAAAVVKVAFLTEALTTLLAFLALALLSPLAAIYLAHDAQTTPFFLFYGLSILGNLVTETAVGVLQVAGQFRSQAVVNLGQSVLTAAIIGVAFFAGGGMMIVLTAYLLGKVILGVGTAWLALKRLNLALGKDWWRASFAELPPWRELATFGVSSNLSATVNLFVRDSELLWVAFFLSPLETGYYKVALAIINLVMTPINPFIHTTFPEITRSIAEYDWPRLRRLLRRVTAIAGGWTGLIAFVLIVFGQWVILFYGREYLPAYPALVVLLAGFGVSNILFWNRPLLLSLGLPMTPFKITLGCGLVKIALAFVLVPHLGYVAEAALLSGYFILSVLLIVRRGFREIRRAEALTPAKGAA